jgi:2-polyprenyl-3-methyl-5-hydroxy-6-metoxy-1,4-benzoquinol methylase
MLSCREFHAPVTLRALARQYGLHDVLQVLYAKLVSAPQSSDATRASHLFNQWWYYDAELFPGIIRDGIYPRSTPLLPRILLRKCNLSQCDCLDIGSMEGLIPILMKKQGACEVVATDFSYDCYGKLRALATIHNVDVKFRKIGLLYELAKKLSDRHLPGFDMINVSGVLYHVFSPMHVLAGVRPLLKKNGLIIVSTNVVDRDDCSMEFNEAGALQREANTFWYMSPRMLNYMLKYFQLSPIDCLYYKYPRTDEVRFSKSREAGYLCVVCRAVTDRGAQFNDEWLSRSLAGSWEYRLCDQAVLERQATSAISYQGERGPIDVAQEIARRAPLEAAPTRQDSHCLFIADTI